MGEDKHYWISKLIRNDIGEYRRRGLEETGQYKHEPLHYYKSLEKIYENLEIEDLRELCNLKFNS